MPAGVVAERPVAKIGFVLFSPSADSGDRVRIFIAWNSGKCGGMKIAGTF
jgi:predicted RNA-binding protein with TRAM domain